MPVSTAPSVRAALSAGLAMMTVGAWVPSVKEKDTGGATLPAPSVARKSMVCGPSMAPSTGNVGSVELKPTLEPKNASSTTAAAPLNVLWPETYSGKGGVVKNGIQVGSATTAGLTPLPPV